MTLAPRHVAVAACLIVGLVYFALRDATVREQEFHLGADAAAHFIAGVDVADLLAAGDGEGLRRFVRSQTYWPFLHPVLLGAFLSVAGADPKTAILFTNLAALGCGLLLYLAGTALDPSRSGRAGAAFATANLLTSPIFVVFAATTMREVPVLFFVLLTTRLFFWALDGGRRLAFLCTGASLAALFFTRYEYGLITLACVAATLLVDRAWRHPRRLPATLALLFLPLAVVLGWWLSLGDAAETLRGLGHTLTWRHDAGSFGELRYADLSRARLFVRNVVVAFQAYDALFYANLALALVAVARWRRAAPKVSFLVLLLLVFSYATAVHPLQEGRFALPFFPLLWLLSGFGFARVLASIERDGLRNGIALLAIASILALGTAPAHDIFGRGRVRGPFSPARAPHPRELLRLIDAKLASGADVTIVGGLENAFSPGLVRWELGRKQGRELRIGVDDSAGVLRLVRPGEGGPPPAAYVIAVRQPGPRGERARRQVRGAVAELRARPECFRLDDDVRIGAHEVAVFRVLGDDCDLLERPRRRPGARSKAAGSLQPPRT